MTLDTNTLNSLRIDRSQPVNHPDKKSLPIKWIVSVIILAVVLSAWFFLKPEKPSSQPTPVLEKPIQKSVVSDNVSLEASGYVVARRQATVSAKVTGKIQQVFIEEGAKIKAGELIAKLDDSNIKQQVSLAEHQLAAAQSDLKTTQIKLAQAQRNAQRIHQLRQDKLISDTDFDNATSTVDTLKSQLDTAQHQLDIAKDNLKIQQQNADDLLVRAPFDGVVISKDAQPGEIVSPISSGGYTRSGIATLVDMDSREIEVDVNESFIHRVHDNQKTEAILDAYPDWIIPSHVIGIVPAADRQKATVRVRIAFEKLDTRILPDMGVKVRFLTEK